MLFNMHHCGIKPYNEGNCYTSILSALIIYYGVKPNPDFICICLNEYFMKLDLTPYWLLFISDHAKS